MVDGLITEAVAAAGGSVRGVGISCAGPIDLPSGTVGPINIDAWQRFPILDRVNDSFRGHQFRSKDISLVVN